mmetsp:Transcript_29620/g.60478  ORF Transcript_29620/g.60478 Transcript_29620/m.60478 type:complete len:468 (+) Transcript_29620:368-1771(+)
MNEVPDAPSQVSLLKDGSSAAEVPVRVVGVLLQGAQQIQVDGRRSPLQGGRPSALDDLGDDGDVVLLPRHPSPQVHDGVPLQELSPEGLLGQGQLGRAADEKLGPELHDVHDREEQALVPLLLLTGDHLRQQLLEAVEDDVVVGGFHHGESHLPREAGHREGEGLLISVDEAHGAQVGQFPALGLELLRGEELDVLNLAQLGEDCDHDPVPLGGGGSLEVEGVGEDGAEEHPGDLHGGPPPVRQEGVGYDGRHGPPGADVDVDGLVGDDRLGLQRVVVDDPHHVVHVDVRVHLRRLLVIHEADVRVRVLLQHLLHSPRLLHAPLLQRELRLRVDLRRQDRRAAVQLRRSDRPPDRVEVRHQMTDEQRPLQLLRKEHVHVRQGLPIIVLRGEEADDPAGGLLLLEHDVLDLRALADDAVVVVAVFLPSLAGGEAEGLGAARVVVPLVVLHRWMGCGGRSAEAASRSRT